MFKNRGVPLSQIEVLRKVPFFAGLPDKTLARIDSHIDEVSVEAGTTLTREGTGAYEAFVIAEGTAEVRVGHEVVAHTSVGELIGEIGVLKHTLRKATVIATTPMRLFVMNPSDLVWLFEDAGLSARINANLAKHLGGTQDKFN